MSKKIISKAEFEKRVEIEFCFLVYTEYLKKEEAWKRATYKISQEYSVD